jgi:hypothetical protein
LVFFFSTLFFLCSDEDEIDVVEISADEDEDERIDDEISELVDFYINYSF